MPERLPMLVSLLAAGSLLTGCTPDAGSKAVPSDQGVSEVPSAGPETTTQPPGSAVGQAALQESVIITFYASYDNDPPGSTAVAHPDIQPEAGGSGTYDDPLTLAARSDVSDVFPPGRRVYVPRYEKYFIRSDDCGESPSAPDGCETQIDLYMGNPSQDEAVLDCEDELTPDGPQTVILDPPDDLPVSVQPFWDDTTGECFDRK